MNPRLSQKRMMQRMTTKDMHRTAPIWKILMKRTLAMIHLLVQMHLWAWMLAQRHGLTAIAIIIMRRCVSFLFLFASWTYTSSSVTYSVLCCITRSKPVTAFQLVQKAIHDRSSSNLQGREQEIYLCERYRYLQKDASSGSLIMISFK